MQTRTAAVHALRGFEHGAVIPPMHLASTFELDPATEERSFAYQRGADPPGRCSSRRPRTRRCGSPICDVSSSWRTATELS